MPSLSIRISYYTSENRMGEVRLWFASSTKKDFRETVRRHRIAPHSIFKFEVNGGNGYIEKSLEKLLGIVEED